MTSDELEKSLGVGHDKAYYRQALEKLLPVLCMSAWGEAPEVDFDFNPVRDLSDAERAQLAQTHTATVAQAFQAGLVDRETALAELRRQGRGTGFWLDEI